MSWNMRYFYVEDDTAIFFAANGAGLSGLLLSLTDVVPFLHSGIPTYPMWIYFTGLFFAFLSKAVIDLQNADTRQREKHQHARDFILHALASPDGDDNLKSQIENLWEHLEKQRNLLLTIDQGPKLDRWRATFYFLSGLCFLTSTAIVIIIAGSLRAS